MVCLWAFLLAWASPYSVAQFPVPFHWQKGTVLPSPAIGAGPGGLGDLDGDGVAEVIQPNFFFWFASTGGPLVASSVTADKKILNYYGAQVWPHYQNIIQVGFIGTLAMDYDRDGLTDVLLVDNKGNLFFLKNGGIARRRDPAVKNHRIVNKQYVPMDVPFLPPVRILDIASRSAPQGQEQPYKLTELRTVDLDGNGYKDIVISGVWYATPLPRILQKQDGGIHVGFRSATGVRWVSAARPGFPNALTVADVDKSSPGLEILAALDSHGTSSPIVMYRTAGGNLRRVVQPVRTVPWTATTIDAGDMDNDKIPDLVVGGLDESTGAERILLLKGLPAAQFRSHSLPALPQSPHFSGMITTVKLIEIDHSPQHASRVSILALRGFSRGNSQLIHYFSVGGDGRFFVDPPEKVHRLGVSTGNLGKRFNFGRIDNFIADQLRMRLVDADGDRNPDLFFPFATIPDNGNRLGFAILYNTGSVADRGRVEVTEFPSEGTGHYRPRIGTGGGYPVIGNKNFELRVDDTLGGVPTHFILAAQAADLNVGGHRFLVHEPLGILSGQASGQGSGAGEVRVPLPIPYDRSLLGLKIFVQAFSEDPGPPPQRRVLGVTLSNRLELQVGEER